MWTGEAACPLEEERGSVAGGGQVPLVAFQGAERDVEHAQRIALLIIFENELAAFNVVELLPDPWQAGQGKLTKKSA